jgi:hypothetical protein
MKFQECKEMSEWWIYSHILVLVFFLGVSGSWGWYSIWMDKKMLKIPKGIIRICKSKKDIQHNGQKKNDKQWSTKHTHKTKDQVTQTLQKTGGELRWSGRVSSYCSTCGTHCVNLVTNPVISHE